MDRTQPASLDQAIHALRTTLPVGAPIVTLPSVRTHDWTEVVRGVVLPLGLASWRFAVDWCGEFASDHGPSVYAFEGTIGQQHQPTLVPLLENAARQGGSLLIAAQGFDHAMLSLLIVNHTKATVRATAVMPPPGTGTDALKLLAQLAAGSIGNAGDALVYGQGGTVPRYLASLDRMVVVGDFAHPSTGPIGLVFVGGRDLAHARARVSAARAGPDAAEPACCP